MNLRGHMNENDKTSDQQGFIGSTPDYQEGQNSNDKGYRDVIFQQSCPVATLTLNRPDIRNAFTRHEMIDEIVDV